MAFQGTTPFFTAWLFFGLDFTSFCICIPQSRPIASFGAFLTYHFFFTTGRRKDETDVKYFKYF